jgi:hypothetical protein
VRGAPCARGEQAHAQRRVRRLDPVAGAGPEDPDRARALVAARRPPGAAR